MKNVMKHVFAILSFALLFIGVGVSAFGEPSDATGPSQPHPIGAPIQRRPQFIECRNNQLFVIPVREAARQVRQALAAIAQSVQGDTQLFVEKLAATKLEAGAYSVSLKNALGAEFVLEPKPSASGCQIWPENDNAADCLLTMIERIDPNLERVVFLVRGKPTPELEQALEWTKTQGVEAELQTLEPSEPLKFGLRGDLKSAK